MIVSKEIQAIEDQLDAELTRIIDNPENAAMARTCGHVITGLGEVLHRIGGLDLMTRVLDRVAQRNPDQEAQREGIMDRRWHGVGRSQSSSGWCS